MPYIPDNQRRMAWKYPNTVGELTYSLYLDCVRYLERQGNGLRFQDFAEVLGALEAAKLELYRRRVAPYEDIKLQENGDV